MRMDRQMGAEGRGWGLARHQGFSEKLNPLLNNPSTADSPDQT